MTSHAVTGVVRLAADLGVEIATDINEPADDDFAWNGKRLTLTRLRTRYSCKPAMYYRGVEPIAGVRDVAHRYRARRPGADLFHDLAHYQLAAPYRRGRADFGLNMDSDPDEERLASFLGIAWEYQYRGWRAARETLGAHSWVHGQLRFNEWDSLGGFLEAAMRLERAGYLESARPVAKVRKKGERLP